MIEKTKQIADLRRLTRNLPTYRYVDPDYVYLSLTNNRSLSGEFIVKPGDYVKIGEVVGHRKGAFFEQNIHSTVSGTVVGLVKKFHRSGKLIDFLKIENDKKNIFYDGITDRSPEEIKNLSREEFINIVKEQSLTGLGGSSFPTYIKLQTKDKIDKLLINAIECEPYITSDHRLVMEFTFRIMRGIRYLMNFFDAKVCYICIKKKYQDLYDTLTAILPEYPDIDVRISRVGNFYPQGWEIAMIKSCLGIDIPTGVLPSKFGIANFNVSTVVGLYKAIRYNIPVVKRNYTLTGDGIKNPQNFRVRVGTEIRELIDLCGGYVDDADKVFIMGGPMMGSCIIRDDAVVSRTVTSTIILQHHTYQEEPCVRCASCTYSCPVHLAPVSIMNAVKANDVEALKKMNLRACVECGLCTYTCTSKIHVTDFVRKAKKMAK